MSEKHLTYPFVAITGMELPKLALKCSVVNPHLKTVLIRGVKGTAKTVLSRAIGGISGTKVVNIPVNVSEEQLFGGMDLDVAINEGRVAVSDSLLLRGNGNILYVDNIGLMDQNMAISLLDSVREGTVRLEREGISMEYDVDAILIATMDPGESEISSHLMDRFDLCAYSESDDVNRKTILTSNVGFMNDPEGFIESYHDEMEGLCDSIRKSKEILSLVSMDDTLLELCVELSSHVNTHGFRGDIALVETAMTIAAIDNRDIVVKADVEDAARLCLVHRRNDSTPPVPEENDDSQKEEDEHQGDQPDDGQDDDGDQDDNRPDERADRDPESQCDDFSQMLQDMLFDIGEEFRVVDYLKNQSKYRGTCSSRKGRREVAISNDTSGRYIKAKVPQGRIHDVAFDATIREAAPFQRVRESNGLAFNIRSHDIRVKVREVRSGCTILFLVDASGSLGVRKRMSVVKGAVMSMLKDSYVKRDRIGLMEFRRDSAELILPPTRSIEYSFKLLEDLPTGGRTPLSQALLKASEYMGSYARSHKGEKCHIVLITDGHANVPLSKDYDATEEVRKLASDIHVPNLGWVVIDASARYSMFSDAEMLAAELGAVYLKLESLDADRMVENLRSVIR